MDVTSHEHRNLCWSAQFSHSTGQIWNARARNQSLSGDKLKHSTDTRNTLKTELKTQRPVGQYIIKYVMEAGIPLHERHVSARMHAHTLFLTSAADRLVTIMSINHSWCWWYRPLTSQYTVHKRRFGSEYRLCPDEIINAS